MGVVVVSLFCRRDHNLLLRTRLLRLLALIVSGFLCVGRKRKSENRPCARDMRYVRRRVPKASTTMHGVVVMKHPVFNTTDSLMCLSFFLLQKHCGHSLLLLLRLDCHCRFCLSSQSSAIDRRRRTLLESLQQATVAFSISYHQHSSLHVNQRRSPKGPRGGQASE